MMRLNLVWRYICMGVMMGVVMAIIVWALAATAVDAASATQKTIIVPAGGLRFVAEDGQLLMMLVRDQGQRPALMLYGPDGTATIALVADSAGGMSFISLAGRPDENGSTFGIAQLRSAGGHGELRLTNQDTGQLTLMP